MEPGDGTRLIHRFWAGRSMPDEYVIFGQMWEAMNPGWHLVDWDERCLVDFPELQPVFDSLYERDAGRHGIELYVQLADVLGYAIVEKWGGVYVNCDMQPVRPLPALPDKAWASLENNEDGRIVNAAIGAEEPNDSFWRGLLTELPGRYFANPTGEMVQTTGPALLTDYAHAHPALLHVFPVETFNSLHWKQIPEGGDAFDFIGSGAVPPEAIAVHHWGHRKSNRSNHVENATQ